MSWAGAALAAAVTLLALGPAPARAAVPPPRGVGAPAAILVEASTGEVVAARRADERRPIASTTKLMTALVTFERARLDAVFRAPPYSGSAAESRLGLRTGERMRVRDLLRALLLPSANDAAATLAAGVGGSRAAFVGLMNRRARELGLRRTHYTNPVGLDAPGNYSSASDLVRLARVALRRPFFSRTVNLRRTTLSSGDHPRAVFNRDTLLGSVPWIDGVKTGHTQAAGYVLVGSGTRHGLTFLSAVLGTPSEAARDADTLALLRFGFAHYAPMRLARRGQMLARRGVRDRPGVRVAVVARSSLVRVLPRSAAVRRVVELPVELRGPRPRGARVGTLVLRAGGRVAGRVALVTARDVPAAGGASALGRLLGWPATLLPIVVILGGLGVGLARRRRRQRRREERRRRRARIESAA